MIRVLVRSTSPFTRAGLESAISADPRFEIVNVIENSSLDFEQDPDVILLDGAEPDLEKLRPASVLAAHAPRCVLLADGVTRSELARLVKLGVRAVLPRDSSPQEIAVALEAATQDLVAITTEFLESLLPAGSEDSDEEDEFLQESLTARETEVLALLAEGAGNKEIAAKLNISEHTAKFHVSSILGKLGATTRTEAVTRGYRLGLIFI